MKQNKKLKLFISYSHFDEKYIKEFRKHIAPLKSKGLIEDWDDRKITAGKDFQEKIDNNLGNADIICLFISANFLSSLVCMQEKKDALKLRKKKGIVVVPIILSACGWLDDKEISSLLALPTDGKPISDFTDSNKAWNNVYEGLKDIIEKEVIIKQLKITKAFSDFLQNTELLSKAHSQKEKVFLHDIFVYPELEKYNDLKEYEKNESSGKLIESFCDYSKILIAGENQSGKTTLCKKIFMELREENFVPVYISGKTNHYQGKIENTISKAYKEQYENVSIVKLDKQRMVPILDDFHFAKNKEKHIQDLSTYRYQIIVVDDIFSLNFKDEQLVNFFTYFKIKELSPSLRNQLIKKWTRLTDKKNDVSHNENEIYQIIDNKTELVNTALGKIIGSGIMPAYPFFILSVISTYEIFAQPLDQEITSQGYCYQALIYMYLRKQGVKNDEIDIYINFLIEFAFYFYMAKKNELSADKFNSFMELYLKKYHLPIKQELLLKNLQETGIIALDSFNNYTFCYPYLYYFFVAKYLAEHIADNKKIIDSIIKNFHKDKNAYIAIFISHHSKDDYILDEIILNALCLFDKHKSATLNKEELNFFDEQVNIIVKAVLPSTNLTPEKERNKRLKTQDAQEQTTSDEKKNIIQEKENYDDFTMKLRRSCRTIEVMGRIIKNRAGSLEKSRLEFIFEEAMKINLRILTLFFEIIKNEETKQDVINIISTRLNKTIEDKQKKNKGKKEKPKSLSQEKIENLAKVIFWNLNFFMVYVYINKIIHSLGSDKLTAIIAKVCDKENSPASFLIKHGILMWYKKNLQTDNIAKRIKSKSFSKIAKNIMRFMIFDHLSMHSKAYKERQKIENKFGFLSKKQLLKQVVRNERYNVPPNSS